jgi:hypothetical protein
MRSLKPRCFRVSPHPFERFEDARSAHGPPCDVPKPARKLCLTPKGWPRCRARLLSSHVALAFPVPFLAPTLRSLRRKPLLGPAVVRPCERPSALSSAFTAGRPLRSSRSRSPSPGSNPRSSFDAHGRLRSFGPQSTGSRIRVTFPTAFAAILFREPPSPAAPVRSPMLAFQRSPARGRRSYRSIFTALSSGDVRRSRGLNFRLCPGTGSPSHLSTLTTLGTSVLTFAQRGDSAPLPIARSRGFVDSRTCSLVPCGTVSNTLPARVHIQRIVIEKVWRLRLRNRRPARAFETSDQTPGPKAETTFAAPTLRS